MESRTGAVLLARYIYFFFFQAEDGIRDHCVTGVQTCALPICAGLAISDLPNIDLVLITHAHFDHLNRRTLRAIAARQPIVVPSGVTSLVHDLGFEKVREMNWWDEWEYRGLKITFTPAKHWGARVLHDRHRGYGGFVIEVAGGQGVYYVGPAYFSAFFPVGRRLPPPA